MDIESDLLPDLDKTTTTKGLQAFVRKQLRNYRDTIVMHCTSRHE